MADFLSALKQNRGEPTVHGLLRYFQACALADALATVLSA